MSPTHITSDRSWLEKHLRPLMDAGNRLVALDNQLPAHLPSYDRGYWTGLKLIALKYYLPAYLNILARRKKVGFVDLFAGPGLNRIGDRRVPLPGSPLIPLMIRETAVSRFFGGLFLCEQNQVYYDALRKRVSAQLPQGCEARYYLGDANDFVEELPAQVAEAGIEHCLVFVDPEGLEWHWESMRKLISQVDCDVIVNFPSAGLQRISTKTDETTRNTIGHFLGIPADELPAVVDEEWAIAEYRKGLGELGKNVSTEIMITDFGAYHYHLIPAVRETARGTPWFSAFLQLRQRVHRLHGEILNLVAQQIDGTLGVIDQGSTPATTPR